MKIIKLLTLTLLTTLTGCASVVSDSNYDVKLDSYPRGADITIKDKAGKRIFAGQTPELVSLDSGAGFFQGAKYTVEYKKKGYQPSYKIIDSSFDAWVVGNVLVGGLAGIVIDGATGAMWKIEQSQQPQIKKISEDSREMGK